MKKFHLLFLVLLSPYLFGQTVETQTYDFESLSTGPIHGQDNWVSEGGTAGEIATGTTSGLYSGSKLVKGANTFSNGSLSRLNDGNWSIPSWNNATEVTIEMTFKRNDYNQGFMLGYDANSDGNFSNTTPNTYARDANELSFGFGRSLTNFYITKADGSMTSAPQPIATAKDNFYRFRLVVDLTANSGAGSGTLHFRDMTNSGSWVTVPGLTNINMGINTAAADQTNFNNLNGIFIHADKDNWDSDDIQISVTSVATAPPADVPTLSQWGLIILALMFMTMGTLYLIQPNMEEKIG